jgi:hypothetical protein
MIRNALIALYVLLVLTVSAVSRADGFSYPMSPEFFDFKHSVGPVNNPPRSVDPLPGSVGTGHNLMITFGIGPIEITR